METSKKNLSKPIKLLIYLLITLLYCCAAFAVYIIALNPIFDMPDLIYTAVTFVPLFFPVVAEFIFTRKTDINPFLLMTAPVLASLICFAFFAVITGNTIMSYSDRYLLFVISLISCAVRAFFSIVDCISAKKYKAIIASIVATVITVSAVFMSLAMETVIVDFVIYSRTGEADRTGSWGAINQYLQRDDNWQDYVGNTPFALGEITKQTDEYGEEYNSCDIGTYPNIDGSTVCVPMAVEFARQHLNFPDEAANSFVSFSTTHYAYENLLDPVNITSSSYVFYSVDAFIDFGSVDLLLATEPSDEELALAERNGITLVKEPVCYDAFVFITHKDNPVDSLSVEQIQDIYSGKITNWSEVGGKNEKIRAFQREKNSGSQTAMENLVMKGNSMIDPISVPIVVGMGELVDAVAEYENETASIGYTYRYYIDNLYKNDSIKTIAVDGIVPSDNNIRNKNYPFTTNYYGVIRQGDEENEGGKFLQWILSEEGQKCVEQAGYITLNELD